jgi:carboxyl-terminal processing protease
MDVQRQGFEASHGRQTVTPRLARAPRGRVGRRHALILLVPAALLVLATACAQTSSLDDPFALMADSVIGAGFTHISERFLEPVSMPDIATDSMAAVSQFDGTLKVVRQKDRVELDQDGQLLHAYSLPKGEDPEAWADVTTALFEDARLASAKLHDTDPELIYAAVFGRALSHLDRFSRYAAPAVAREQRAQRDGFGGIGISLKQDGDNILIDTVFDGTPAADAGVKAHNLLLAVDGQAVKGVSIGDIVDRLRGPIGSSVMVTLSTGANQSGRDVSLRRALIIPSTVSYSRADDIAYIRISSFNQNTAVLLRQAILRAMHDGDRPPRGLVLDLRDNPGGLLDQAVDAAELFLSHGRILSTSGRHPDSNQVFDASGADELSGRPVAVLVNGNTASAAEVLAAALQDQGRALLVGSVSYGKGTVQTVHRLPNDGELVITWSRIHAPSGYTLNQVGVIPNVCTSRADGEGAAAIASLLAMVRSGRLDTAAARASLHATPQPSPAEIRGLRASCPAETLESKLDLQVADRILSDKTLVANALQPVGAAEIAKRQ